MVENCSVIFYARDGCGSFYTAKNLFRHQPSRFSAAHNDRRTHSVVFKTLL